MRRVNHTVTAIREEDLWRVSVSIGGRSYTYYVGGARAAAVRGAVASALRREEERHERT